MKDVNGGGARFSCCSEHTKIRLHQINDYVAFHTEFQSCINFIQSIDKEKIFLITSASHASQILPHIAEYHQIDSIFLLCLEKVPNEHLLLEYPKLIGIYKELDALYLSIEEQIDLVDKQLQTFNFFHQYQNSTRDLSKQSTDSLWFQLFNDVILHSPRDQHAKKQMIDACRHYYQGNSKELKLIDEFEHEYRPEEAIRWYLKKSFLNRMVSKALRTEDIDELYTFRYFMGALVENLVREHQKMIKSGTETMTVYRGIKLSSDAFKKLKENEGKIISTNGFLMTNRHRSAALAFATKSITPNDLVAVLSRSNVMHKN